MSLRRKWEGGALALVGFVLSPLSWWNDLFVNVPLAVGFGWLVALIYRPAFEPAVVAGYWITNVLGLVLLQKGIRRAVARENLKPYSRRDLLRDALASFAYTLVIAVLIKLGIVRPLAEYSFGPGETRQPLPAREMRAMPPARGE